jgi:hypothetical protein
MNGDIRSHDDEHVTEGGGESPHHLWADLLIL